MKSVLTEQRPAKPAVATRMVTSRPYQDWSGPRMIGLEEKEHEEPVHMTCSLLCRLCSSAGPTVTDSLSRGFFHMLSPLERSLLISAFQVILTPEMS